MLAQPLHHDVDLNLDACSCWCCSASRARGCFEKLLPAVAWESSFVTISPTEHGLTVRQLDWYGMAGCLVLRLPWSAKIQLPRLCPDLMVHLINVSCFTHELLKEAPACYSTVSTTFLQRSEL